jgi:hypothetical protein
LLYRVLVDSKGVKAVLYPRMLSDQYFLSEQKPLRQFSGIEAAICWESSTIVVW